MNGVSLSLRLKLRKPSATTHKSLKTVTTPAAIYGCVEKMAREFFVPCETDGIMVRERETATQQRVGEIFAKRQRGRHDYAIDRRTMTARCPIVNHERDELAKGIMIEQRGPLSLSSPAWRLCVCSLRAASLFSVKSESSPEKGRLACSRQP